MPRITTEADAALSRIVAGALAGDCETETLDFKEDRSSIGDTERLVADAVICFANSAGGTIVLGVRDKARGPEALIGTRLEPGKVKQRVYELSSPHITVEARFHASHPTVMVISVPQSSDIHSDTQGRASRRINRDCLPMTPDQQARLREERRGIDWSAESSGRSINEISEEALAVSRSILARFADERRKLATLSRSDLCTALGLMCKDGGLNRAGDLLFCGDGGVGVVYQYRVTPGGEPRDVQRLTAPFVTAFSRVMDLVTARRISTPLNLPNGQQVSIEDFPQLAVREALSNAVCHRDYHLDGAIIVDHSPETFTVTSPGPLVSGVTPSNIITTTSRPRNPVLAKAARILGFAEELGRGVDRMYREMIRSGRQTPVIETEFDRVRVAFVGGAPDTNIARFVISLPEEEQDDTDTMLILLRLCSTRTITAATAAPLLQKSLQEAEAVLRRLSTDGVGLLEKTRATVGRSAGTYRLRGEALKGLGAAVLYQRRTADEIDKKVVAHVSEYGKITNRTLQNVFDVDVYKARDILADLVRRNVLSRVSETARGPKVEWGPGTAFPGKRGAQRKAARGRTNLLDEALPLWSRVDPEDT